MHAEQSAHERLIQEEIARIQETDYMRSRLAYEATNGSAAHLVKPEHFSPEGNCDI